MENMKDKAIGYILMLVAVVVILESVVLIGGLGKKEVAVTEKTGTESGKVAVVALKSQPAEVAWVLQTENTTMKIGKKYLVTVSLMPKKNLKVDGVEAFVKYPVGQIIVTGMKDGKEMPKSVLNMVSEKTSTLIGRYLMTGAALQLVNGKPVEVLTFEVQPTKVGTFSLEVSTGTELAETTSLVVENTTARAIPYESNILTITAEK
jgi:hypothetical protein